MDLIIDANVVLALLINPNRFSWLLFSKHLRLFAPELLREELQEKREMVHERSRFTDPEIVALLHAIEQHIRFVPIPEFIMKWEEAAQRCPDPDDLMYFALALQLRCPIWSNDKQLKMQSVVPIYATHELMRMFGMAEPSNL